MPEPEKKPPVQKAEEKQVEDVAKVNEKSDAVLSAAAESGDAAVHQLLGERVVAEQNQDTDELKRIDKELGELLNK